MDLLEMINNGAEALHRGSVDREELLNSSQDAQKPPTTSSGDRRQRNPEIPVWARVHRGRANQVRDQRLMELAQTRPELADFLARWRDTSNDTSASAASAPTKPSANGIANSIGALAEIGPGGNVSLTGLAPSIANIIPNDDQTKVLAGWVFERIEKITDEALLDSVEIEFKLGIITEEHGGLRHRMGVLSECVVDPVYFTRNRLHFKSDVDPKAFRTLETLLDGVLETNAGTANNQVTRDNILLRDAMYNIEYAPLGNGKRNVRVSSDEHGRVLECLSKQRIGDLHIALPNSAYDLKMSLSIEHPVDTESFLPLIKGKEPHFGRNKNRLKWKAPGCEIDLTSVHGGGANGASRITKEAEVEANTKFLASVLREYRSKVNPGESLDKFLEIIRYTMDSARYLSRNL